MSRRLIVSGGSRPRELVLVDTLIVGRDPACDVSEQNDPLMSRRHAAFTADAKHAVVKDLGSRNGILVNGVKTPEALLRHGDVVQIGHLQVKFVDEVGPFRDAFDSAQGKPFDAAQGKPFDCAQGEPFDSAQGKPNAEASDAATVIVDNVKTVVLDAAIDVTRKL